MWYSFKKLQFRMHFDYFAFQNIFTKILIRNTHKKVDEKIQQYICKWHWIARFWRYRARDKTVDSKTTATTLDNVVYSNWRLNVDWKNINFAVAARQSVHILWWLMAHSSASSLLIIFRILTLRSLYIQVNSKRTKADFLQCWTQILITRFAHL